MNSNNLGSQPRKSLSNRTPSSISLNKGNVIQNKPNIPTKAKTNIKTVTNTLSCTHNINNKTGSSLTTNRTTTTHTPDISSATTHSTLPTSGDSHATNNDNTLSTDKNTINKLNYALATANSNTPKREQAIVLHPVDGLLLKDYIIAIGQIISPNNIIFVSKISMSRVCIFLSSEHILCSLLEKTQNKIKINQHEIPIRRLLNPAKRIIISNVCPSIPNQTIMHALEQINIIPISEINYLKAGIKEAGYEHILSFRRQIYIKHEDIPKLPGSLLININETNFRIFFTDDTITCYTCKSIGHTSMSCNKNITDDKNLTQPLNQQNILTHHSNVFTDDNIDLLENTLPPEILPFNEQITKNQMEWSDDAQYPPLASTALINPESTQHTSNLVDSPQQTLNTENLEETTFNATFHDQIKRPISETKSQQSPTSPLSIKQPDKKKAKVLSRSNSSTKLDDKNSDSILQSTEPFFSSTDNNNPITYLQFKYILENFGNKQMNIHTLCEDIGSNIPSILETIEKIRPLINDRSMKTKLTKLSNLLFQTQPPQDNSESLQN